MDKSKRSLVKHRTNAAAAAGGGSNKNDGRKKKGGFRSVGANLPDGAYLGKAKKLKANLIQNAKIKSKFYKSQGPMEGQARKWGAGQGGGDDDGGEASTSANPLGRFARQDGRDDDDVTRGVRSGGKPRNKSRRSDGEGDASADVKRKARAGPAPPSEPSPPAPTPAARRRPQYASREEALEARAKRQEKWNQTSKSVQGSRRGQPDLGARMDVLLDKIKSSQE